MNPTGLTGLDRLLAQSGLALLIQSCIVLLLGLGLGRALRRRGPLAQSVAYRATLAAVVCTGLFSAVFASYLHPLWRFSLPEAPQEAVALPAETGAVSGVTGKAATAPSAFPTAPPVETGTAPLPAPSALPEDAPVVSETPPTRPWTNRFYAGIVAIWGAGALVLLAWFGLGQWMLFRLRRGSVLVTSGAAFELLTTLSATSRLRRPLTLQASPRIHSPFLAGVRRPAIYLPASYAQDFDAAELRAILAHEAAHQERQDVAWTLAARLTCALLWPQPFLWLLCRRMEQSAEEACDVLALTQGCPPRAYADCLLSLAERLTPSRAERNLGLGVVPFRSQVGRRIQQILSGTTPPRRLSRRLRLGIAALALVAVPSGLLVIAVGHPPSVNASAAGTPHPWVAPDGYLAQFTSAQRWGGVQPIRILSVFDKTVLYPTVLTEEEKSLVRQCKQLTVYNTDYGSGGPPLHDRRVLEAILAQHPHFFLAEDLLGVWYTKSHDLHSADLWTARALQDAPAIIAGRVQFADGRPVDGLTFRPSVSLYRSANFMDGPEDYNDPHNFQLHTTTDAHGCYYLPVFRAVYETPAWSWSSGETQSATARLATRMDVMSPQTGHGGLSRFMVTGRVGALPPMIVRPYLPVGAPFTVVNQKQNHPLRVAGPTMTVTWPRYPGASQYEASLEEVISLPYGGREFSNLDFLGGDPHFHGAVPNATLRLPLSSNTPVFFRTRLYELLITARDADGNQLANSQPYYFQPLSGIGPQPLTNAGFEKILPPGFTIIAISKTAGGGVITGTMPAASNLDVLLARKPFGWASETSAVWPFYAGGVYAQRDRFRIVYSNTGQVTPGSAAPGAAAATTPQFLDAQCASHLKQIGLAVMRYAQNHGQRFPDASRWMDEITPYVKDASVFHDPAAPAKYGYAFNRALSGLPLDRLTGNAPQSVVAIFDSTKGVRNASDTGQSLPAPGRHAGGSEFLFADGHVKRLQGGQSLFSIPRNPPSRAASISPEELTKGDKV